MGEQDHMMKAWTILRSDNTEEQHISEVAACGHVYRGSSRDSLRPQNRAPGMPGSDITHAASSMRVKDILSKSVSAPQWKIT